MPDLQLMGKTFRDLAKSLDLSRKRQGLIASNIANLETPDYHSRDIDFQKSLNQAMKGSPRHLSQTHSKHLNVVAGTTPEVDVADMAGVDIDREMGNLAENNLVYRASVESLLRKFALLKYTINEGGK